MKYCSHETHPPHRNVATITNDSNELAMPLTTAWCYYPTLAGALFALGSGVVSAETALRRSGFQGAAQMAAASPVSPLFKEVADALWLQVRTAGPLSGEHTASTTKMSAARFLDQLKSRSSERAVLG